jgi:predicted PurR-regulated permease PerM
VALCIAVVLYVVLSHFQGVWGALMTFIGFFKTVIIGCVIAFIVNPLSKLMGRSLFRKVKNQKTQLKLSNLVAFILVLLFLAFALLIMIPQLIQSVKMFMANFEGYKDSVLGWIADKGISLESLGIDISAVESAGSGLTSILSNVGKYAGSILSTTVDVGKTIMDLAIAFMMSIYILAEKSTLKKGCARLVRAIVGEDRYPGVCTFLAKTNAVFNAYIVYNLIDCLIIGVINAVFMLVTGMQYVGMISFIIAITNLIPTFGPLIGGAIGAFVLLLVKPIHALIFIIFAVVLQAFDGYILKPRLFGNSLGVSGLWILIGVIVGGKMFGLIGMLISIPLVAVIDFLYRNYLIPRLEKKRGIQPPAEELPEKTGKK